LAAVRAKTAPRSARAKAIQYALNCRPALAHYVDDGRINIDSNSVENSTPASPWDARIACSAAPRAAANALR
jgi:hypothetical protein